MMASLSDLLNTPDYSHQLTKSWLRLAPEYRRANCNWIVLRQHQNAGERGIDIGLEITIIIMAMEDWASYKVDHDTGCVGRFSSEFEGRKTADGRHGLDSSSNFHEVLTFVPNARLVGKEESICKQGVVPNRESCDPRPYVISPVCADEEMLGWFVGEVGSCRVNDGRRFESKDVS